LKDAELPAKIDSGDFEAVLKNGAICPKEPIPREWADGTELEVAEAAGKQADNSLDQWFAELDAACSQMDAEDSQILKDAIREVRRQEKDIARKQMEQG
jgi:hypothetical protein